MKLETIVVGTDFSSVSKPAVDQAVALAAHHGSQLVLVHGTGLVASERTLENEDASVDAMWQDMLRKELRVAAERLYQLAERCRKARVEVTTRVSHGDPDAALVSTARDTHADLVVVGTHGRCGADRWLEGSVAERTLRQLSCNVLVARAPTPPRGLFERVLCPTDFSDTADRGLAAALAFSSPRASIHVLHCWEPPVFYGQAPPSDLLVRMREDARQQGERVCAEHASDARRLRCEVVDAPPIEGIIQRLHSGDREILVIGSHGRRGFRRWILGSIAEAVTRRATASVLIVHGDQLPS